ncbi:hypothetical protein ACFTXM_34750 [Streptomyces sp. NPDC056930]|uniref:hypothetical protein n=1 Tax=Streptomyces sp. NPDC056930 TaxID=3345967 RepID=UPI003639A18F
MTDEEKAQQVARTRAKIMERLACAERALFTRPAPKSARAQMEFLRKREKGSTKSLAERLGVPRKTVQRLPLECLHQAEQAPPGRPGPGDRIGVATVDIARG